MEIKGRGKPSEIRNKLLLLPDGDYDYIVVPHHDDNVITIEKKKKPRSLNANAYFHTLVNQLARLMGTSDEEMKVLEVLKYGTIARNDDGSPITLKLPKKTDISHLWKYYKAYGEDKDCNFYLLYKETHTLDSSEMAKLIDGVVSDCKEQGIETLDDLEIKEMIKRME